MRIVVRRMMGCVTRMTEMVECDYCGQFLDPLDEGVDAELYPVFVGEPPEPPEVECHGRAEKKEVVGAYRGGKQRVHGEDSTITLDQRLDHVQALLNAIEDSRHFKLETFNRTMKAESNDRGFVSPPFDDADAKMDRLIHTTDDDTVAVDLKAQLHANHTPDLMVCEYCRDTLKGEK